MISHISIKDFAIIENVEVDFDEGLNIITGETGAGKSIVIEAVSLALGSRADTAFIRSGKEKAKIQLVAYLDGEEIIISREISMTGKNLCRLNGEIVTLAQLSSACKKIADIHGQYDHQSLLNPEYHINLIDLYGHKTITPVKEQVSQIYSDYKATKTQLFELVANSMENARKRDFMKFELVEITGANLYVGEDEELESKIRILQNSEKIYKNLSIAYELTIESDSSSLDLLDNATKQLSEISTYSSDYDLISQDFSDIYYRLKDMCGEIRLLRDKIVFSQEELDIYIERIELIDSLKRKYGNSIEAILEYANNIEKQLSIIDNIDETKAKLEKALEKHESELQLFSEKLSMLRKKSAKELEEKIMEQLLELNFNNSVLSIDFKNNSGGFSENGIDIVEFLISTNKGEPLKPLAKIASGGEMSRIMLAFKAIIADYDNIPSMIFDEIDSGISGIAASVVGKKLKDISSKHQIICITHLPQIAACGKYNYRISKETDDNETRTTILPLSQEDKIYEIARLLGGINITETTISSAKELIELS